MQRVFNPGRVPIVTGGHVVPAGEWAEVPEAGVSRLVAAGSLLTDSGERPEHLAPDPVDETTTDERPKPAAKPKETNR